MATQSGYERAVEWARKNDSRALLCSLLEEGSDSDGVDYNALVDQWEKPKAAPQSKPRAFYLNRLQDASGVSGTGIVAHGVEFQDGQCVLHWRDSGSIGIYSSLKKVEEIHGHGGRTLVVMS